MLAELKIPSELSQLVHVRKFLREVLDFRYPGLGYEDIYQLELAASEAASNIITHAYRDAPAQEILIEVEVFAERICVRLWHTGKAFSPELLAPPVFDGSQTSGFGLYIIDQCMDKVDYSRNAHGKNIVYMTKNYRAACSSQNN